MSDKEYAIAFAQVDQILNLLDEFYVAKIPKKLRDIISSNKLENYNVTIDPNIPLEKQNISRETRAILAVIDYNYWCENNEQKQKKISKYKENEIAYQKEQEELYNLDNLFKNEEKIKVNNEDKQIKVYSKKESFINKVINKLKAIFKLT